MRGAGPMNMQAGWCPHCGTTTIRCFAPVFVTDAKYSSARASRDAPCAAAAQDVSSEGAPGPSNAPIM